jgi:hypothetical protein
MKRFLCSLLAVAASLTAQAPSNDECAGAIVVSNGVNPSAPAGASGSFYTNAAATTSATTACNSITQDVWFSYTASATGSHTVSTCTPPGFTAGALADSVLAIYNSTAGACPPVAPALACNDEFCASRSQITAALTSGTTYFIRVGSWQTATAGTFYLSITAPTPSLVATVVTAPSAVLSGGGVSIAAAVSTSDGSPLDGTESVLVNLTAIGGLPGTPLLPLGGGLFHLATTATAALGTYSLPMTMSNMTKTGTATATVSVFVLANDVCAGATPIVEGVNGPFTNVGTLAANEPGFNTPCGFSGNVGGSDVFFTYTPSCSGTVTIATCGGNAVNEPGVLTDSQLVAYDSWTCGLGPAAPPVACNDDGDAGGLTCGPNGFESRVAFAVTAGSPYLIRVAGFSAATGAFSLTVTLATAQIETIGAGCGPGPVPSLSGSGAPVFGSTGVISVQAQAAAFGALMGSPMNTGMVYAPFGPCTIYLLQPGMVFLLPIGTDLLGQWSLTATFPAYDPLLDCTGVDLQAFVIGAGGIEFTNALRLVFGT